MILHTEQVFKVIWLSHGPSGNCIFTRLNTTRFPQAKLPRLSVAGLQNCFVMSSSQFTYLHAIGTMPSFLARSAFSEKVTMLYWGKDENKDTWFLDSLDWTRRNMWLLDQLFLFAFPLFSEFVFWYKYQIYANSAYRDDLLPFSFVYLIIPCVYSGIHSSKV